MAKLIKNADGSISFVLDINDPKESDKKKRLDLEKQYKGKAFKDLTQADINALIEVLLKENGLL